MITVTLAPSLTHSVQCSNVLVAGAFTSGGKLSEIKSMCKVTYPEFSLSTEQPSLGLIIKQRVFNTLPKYGAYCDHPSDETPRLISAKIVLPPPV